VTQSKPSKTALKKEQLELQELGERLIGLTADELAALPIGERLRDAVLAATKMRAHGALRRQKQLIGKLMRSTDPEPIRHALEARNADDRVAKRVFADAERWRDRITAGGDEAVIAFCEQCGAAAEPLRERLNSIRGAPSDRIEKGLRRQLFRDIHDALMAATRDDRISR
jgi:ribosome-associated protein